MARLPRSNRGMTTEARLAFEAVEAGDLALAAQYFAKAVEVDKRNPDLRFNLGLALEQIGQIEPAIHSFGQALLLKRDFHEAARRLASLFRRYRLDDWTRFERASLTAALADAKVDHQPVAEAAWQWLKQRTALGPLLATGREKGFDPVARELLLERTDALLADELVLAALRQAINKDAEIEPLLTGLRRVLALEAGPARLEDKALHTFALALASQAFANGYVWAETPEERALAEQPLDSQRLLEGDVESAHRLLLQALYRPIDAAAGAAVTEAGCARVRPRTLRDFLTARLAERESEARMAAALPRIGAPSDPTSQAVARHYSAYPYPRWTSIQTAAPGAARRALARFLGVEGTAFMERPFDVLVAGCGTGQQAVDAPSVFGPNARILGIDLSRPSLAYARRMAERFEARGLELAEADILDMPASGRTFDLILTSGVLHHMADPMAGGAALARCLKPGGAMFLGFYSALARDWLAKLKTEPAYPGPDATDAAVRAYRQDLMRRPQGAPGAELVGSQDFYTMHDFRDLVLHPSEKHVTLPEIERFLTDNGLAFRGFTLGGEAMERFAEANPEEKWPGSLAAWWAFEQANPRTFEAMYQLWCQKAA